MSRELLLILIIAVVITIPYLIIVLTWYKRCPKDKILVIYGRVGKDKEGNTVHSRVVKGNCFVFPIIQSYSYLDLLPLYFEVELRDLDTKQKSRVDLLCDITVAISEEEGVIQKAADLYLGLKQDDIQNKAKDFIHEQLRIIIKNADELGYGYLSRIITERLEIELKKIGLKLIEILIININEKG